MKTLAGDRVRVTETTSAGMWTASCEGCGWTYDPDKAGHTWNRGYRPDVTTAARVHARSCTGGQETLW